MTNLTDECATKTPFISVSVTPDGKIELTDRSIPKNSVKFHKIFNDRYKNYGMSTALKTALEMKLEYFNNAFSKCVLAPVLLPFTNIKVE